jgi:hypothetical protein
MITPSGPPKGAVARRFDGESGCGARGPASQAGAREATGPRPADTKIRLRGASLDWDWLTQSRKRRPRPRKPGPWSEIAAMERREARASRQTRPPAKGGPKTLRRPALRPLRFCRREKIEGRLSQAANNRGAFARLRERSPQHERRMFDNRIGKETWRHIQGIFGCRPRGSGDPYAASYR